MQEQKSVQLKKALKLWPKTSKEKSPCHSLPVQFQVAPGTSSPNQKYLSIGGLACLQLLSSFRYLSESEPPGLLFTAGCSLPTTTQGLCWWPLAVLCWWPLTCLHQGRGMRPAAVDRYMQGRGTGPAIDRPMIHWWAHVARGSWGLLLTGPSPLPSPLIILNVWGLGLPTPRKREDPKKKQCFHALLLNDLLKIPCVVQHTSPWLPGKSIHVQLNPSSISGAGFLLYCYRLSLSDISLKVMLDCIQQKTMH